MQKIINRCGKDTKFIKIFRTLVERCKTFVKRCEV